MTRESGYKLSMAPRLALAVALAMGMQTASADNSDDARAIVKSMSNYVGSLKTIDVSFDSDIEVVTPTLEKLQFTNSGDVQLTRPDKLRAHRVGGYADVSLFFDGKTASVLGNNINSYAQFDAVGSVDQLFHALREGRGIALPGADLLMTNSYDMLMADVTEAKYIGRGVVNGVECEHLAFRNFDTDWQLWVEVGERPFPCKMVVTSKTVNGAPQYTIRIKSWKGGEKHASDLFTFKPTAGMAKLDPNNLISLDELPPESPRGENK